jgi:hypothetical protein
MASMPSRRSLAQRALGGSGARLAGALLVAAGSLASGCLVSFDGYQPLDAGGTGNVAATSTGGTSSGGKSSGGGKPSGGSSSSGAGAMEPIGGEGGATSAGTTNGGSAGTATGGKAGSGGSGGAKGGSGGAGGALGGNAGTSGSGGSGAQTCPVNLSGPPMIEIPKPGGGVYCMDRTEVTNADYKAFLDAGVATTGQGAECDWNSTYQPDISAACTTQPYEPTARPKVPISCIDWCDAKRYCGWAKKRLCGAIAGGSNPPSSYIDPNADQWYRACSKAGTQKFPYGDAYQPSYCIGIDSPYVNPASVASAPSCQGGYDGLFDMSGNVAEWEDSCSAASGANDNCLIRGGSVLDAESTAPSLLCNDSAISDATPMPATAKRNARNELVGLRCCYDP